MKAAAIICEFNPLHLGHEYILSRMRDCSDCTIAIMSGNFVQRAENAVFDKYARAKAAISAGADLVVELPFPWSSASAEFFAAAGTAIAEDLLSDFLVFGASSEDLTLHTKVAKLQLSESFHAMVSNAERTSGRASGTAKIREECLQRYLSEDISQIMRTPNDILAIEYLKQIFGRDLCLVPVPVRRISSDIHAHFRSASFLRAEIMQSGINSVLEFLPKYAGEIFSGECAAGKFADPRKLWEYAFLKMRTRPDDPLPPVADGDGGVIRRMLRCADNAASPDEMFDSAATRKYTNARMRRVALFYATSVTDSMIRRKPRYTLLLAANKKGRAYLAEKADEFRIPIITKPADCGGLSEDALQQYKFSVRADRFYTLMQDKIPCSDAFLKCTPYICE